MYKTAYYFSKFPTLTTTFIQREVRALIKSGADIYLVSNRTPVKGDYHPNDSDLIKRTFYLDHVNKWKYIWNIFDFAIKTPLTFISAIKLAYKLNDNFQFQRLNNFIHIAGAILLSNYFADKEIKHVHVHFAFGAASVAIFLKYLTKITYSISIHGSDVLLKRPLTQEKLSRASFIISNCHYHITNLKRKYPPLAFKRFHLIRLGIDLGNQLWKPAKITHPFPPLNILNVGRLVAVKAHEVLIHACRLLKERKVNFRCRIVGDGDQKIPLQELVLQLGLENYIQFMGSLYEEDVSMHYEWCHVFVLSSKSEGTPMTVIEAMAKARAVVAPDITALPEMIVNNETGLLFQPGSFEDLAQKIQKLSENIDLALRMGKNGQERAENLFDLDRNTKKIKYLLQTR